MPCDFTKLSPMTAYGSPGFSCAMPDPSLHPISDSGAIRPVVDRVFPFQSTTEALAYVEKGRAKGKVVVKIR
jgi:NADPH:quinone reductase-like Zn-dependent oxidoreductase